MRVYTVQPVFFGNKLSGHCHFPINDCSLILQWLLLGHSLFQRWRVVAVFFFTEKVSRNVQGLIQFFLQQCPPIVCYIGQCLTAVCYSIFTLVCHSSIHCQAQCPTTCPTDSLSLDPTPSGQRGDNLMKIAGVQRFQRLPQCNNFKHQEQLRSIFTFVQSSILFHSLSSFLLSISMKSCTREYIIILS